MTPPPPAPRPGPGPRPANLLLTFTGNTGWPAAQLSEVQAHTS
ncbi:hypothetical protein ABZ154_22865 [Streptomyces sp. NPDC006261]